jgi:hypothetical protein
VSGAAAFTRQGESEEASRQDVSLKPEEAADDSIALKARFRRPPVFVVAPLGAMYYQGIDY